MRTNVVCLVPGTYWSITQYDLFVLQGVDMCGLEDEDMAYLCLNDSSLSLSK